MQAVGLQLHIVYKLEHEDIEPLFRVCQELRSMVSRSRCCLTDTTWAIKCLIQLNSSALPSCSHLNFVLLADAHSDATAFHIHHSPSPAI